MKTRTLSFLSASALAAVSLLVACGGDDSSTDLGVPAGGAAGSAGGAGKAGGGGAAGGKAGAGGTSGGASGKAGAGGQSAGGTSAGGAAGQASSGAGGQAAGAAGSGTAGSGTAGSGTGGTGTAGSGTAGSGTAGSGTAGSGTAGSGTGGVAGAAGSGLGGGAGAPASCTGTDTPCALPAGAQGLCRASVCEACAEPADDAVCATAYGAGSRCFAGSCGSCDAVGTTYLVDPVNGSDAIGNGSGTSGGAASSRCAFKTVTAAIKAIGANAAAATLTISVAGPNKLDTTEVYPLKVPAKTTVTATGGDIGIALTTDARGIELSKDGASIDGGSFLIDIDASQQKGNATAGVFVTTGATDASIIRHVRIKETTGAGIAVGGTGRVTIQEGVILLKNGRGNAARAGVGVSDGAFATFDAPAGSDTILIDAAGVGIVVNGRGAIKLTGVPDASAPDKGTIVVQNSVGPGVAISQNPGSGGGALPLNELTGLVSFGNGTGSNGGSGLRASYLSNVKLRGSVLVANKNHGVHVATADGVGPLAVDLGTAADAGRNVVQRTNGQGQINLGVGICLSPGGAVNLTIPARGNVFGPIDCAVTAGTLTKGNNAQGACSQARDTGVDNANPTNSIDVSLCK